MIKVIYKAAGNITTEASVYTASEFVSSFPGLMSKPVLTNSATGQIDPSLIPGVPATSLQFLKKATVPVVRGDCVKADSDTHVSPANYNGTVEEATVLGMAVNDANVGEDVTIIALGILVDSIFNVFPVNSQLFLDVDGGVTDVRITNGYSTLIGKSLGNGSVFVSIREPQRML